MWLPRMEETGSSPSGGLGDGGRGNEKEPPGGPDSLQNDRQTDRQTEVAWPLALPAPGVEDIEEQAGVGMSCSRDTSDTKP